jgi:poly(3-hydroxybutyrate) depolymerase
VYLAYDLSRRMMQPLNLWAGAIGAAFSEGDLARTPFATVAQAGSELLERATRTYEKPSFGLTCVHHAEERIPVSERIIIETPFCRLVRFEKGDGRESGPKVLVVAPLSGHYATLVRETILELLPRHDVYVTDWVDARLVPVARGRFDLHDYIDLVPQLLVSMGERAHVVAVCQPCVPVLAAAATMAADGASPVPRSMTLISGPIDARLSPTRVNRFASDHSLSIIEATRVYRVPPPYAGFGRRVYPGALQLQAFLSLDMARHLEAHTKHFFDVARGDHDAAEKHRKFYDEYFAVLDMPAEFYLSTIAEVFQQHTLAKGTMLHRGTRVQPEAIRETALLTVEGKNDDITGLGQTEAAHALCRGIPARMRQHHLQEGVGHYGTFSGRRWREEIAPVVTQFISRHDA